MSHPTNVCNYPFERKTLTSGYATSVRSQSPLELVLKHVNYYEILRPMVTGIVVFVVEAIAPRKTVVRNDAGLFYYILDFD